MLTLVNDIIETGRYTEDQASQYLTAVMAEGNDTDEQMKFVIGTIRTALDSQDELDRILNTTPADYNWPIYEAIFKCCGYDTQDDARTDTCSDFKGKLSRLLVIMLDKLRPENSVFYQGMKFVPIIT